MKSLRKSWQSDLPTRPTNRRSDASHMMGSKETEQSSVGKDKDDSLSVTRFLRHQALVSDGDSGYGTLSSPSLRPDSSLTRLSVNSRPVSCQSRPRSSLPLRPSTSRPQGVTKVKRPSLEVPSDPSFGIRPSSTSSISLTSPTLAHVNELSLNQEASGQNELHSGKFSCT